MCSVISVYCSVVLMTQLSFEAVVCSVISVYCSVVLMMQLSSVHCSYSDSGLFGVQVASSPQSIVNVSP